MSLHNGVDTNTILGSIQRYTDNNSSREASHLMEVTASDLELLVKVLGPKFFVKAAADSSDEEKMTHEKGVSVEKAVQILGNDKDLEEGFNSWFFDLLSKKLGKEYFSASRGESAALIEDRKKALDEFYKIARGKILYAIRKTYTDYMRTPDAKKITLRKIVLDPDKKEYVEDRDFTRVETELTGTDFGESFDFKDALEAMRSKASSELSGLRDNSFERTTVERNYKVYTTKEPIDKKYKGEPTPTKYRIEIRDIGEFLQKANATFAPGELSEQIPGVLADMFAFFKGKSDLITEDKKGNPIDGEIELDKAIASSFSGDEKGKSFESSRQLEGIFAPKIDAKRYKQLVGLYEKADEKVEKEVAEAVKTAYLSVKKAFNAGDFNLKDLNLDGIIDEDDAKEVNIGDPDTSLIDELRTKGDIMYKVKEMHQAGKGAGGIMVLTFPDLEASGFLTKGQEYTMKTPSLEGFDIGKDYHFSTVTEKSPRDRSIKLKFKEQSEGKERASKETAVEVGLTGAEIKKLTQRMVDTFVSRLKSIPKDKFIEYFGKMVILNGKAMANSSDLGDLIRDEEDEWEKSGPKEDGEDKARVYIDEFKQEQEDKEEDVSDVWEREDLVKFILDQGLEKQSSPLIKKIVDYFPPHPSNTKVFTKVKDSQAFVKWILDTIAFGTKGMKEKIDKSQVWITLINKKLEEGDIFKESPEFNDLYTGQKNDQGGITYPQTKLKTDILKPLMDKVEEGIIEMYLGGDKYLLGLLRVNADKLNKPLERYRLKYEGGKDSDGKVHKGLNQVFEKALDDNNSQQLMKVLNMKPENMTKKHKSMINAIQEADAISKEDRKYFTDIFESKKKAEKKSITRKALFPKTRVKLASINKETLRYIVNTVMSRRGYYNV